MALRRGLAGSVEVPSSPGFVNIGRQKLQDAAFTEEKASLPMSSTPPEDGFSSGGSTSARTLEGPSMGGEESPSFSQVSSTPVTQSPVEPSAITSISMASTPPATPPVPCAGDKLRWSPVDSQVSHGSSIQTLSWRCWSPCDSDDLSSLGTPHLGLSPMPARSATLHSDLVVELPTELPSPPDKGSVLNAFTPPRAETRPDSPSLRAAQRHSPEQRRATEAATGHVRKMIAQFPCFRSAPEHREVEKVKLDFDSLDFVEISPSPEQYGAAVRAHSDQSSSHLESQVSAESAPVEEVSLHSRSMPEIENSLMDITNAPEDWMCAEASPQKSLPDEILSDECRGQDDTDAVEDDFLNEGTIFCDSIARDETILSHEQSIDADRQAHLVNMTVPEYRFHMDGHYQVEYKRKLYWVKVPEGYGPGDQVCIRLPSVPPLQEFNKRQILRNLRQPLTWFQQQPASNCADDCNCGCNPCLREGHRFICDESRRRTRLNEYRSMRGSSMDPTVRPILEDDEDDHVVADFECFVDIPAAS